MSKRDSIKGRFSHDIAQVKKASFITIYSSRQKRCKCIFRQDNRHIATLPFSVFLLDNLNTHLRIAKSLTPKKLIIYQANGQGGSRVANGLANKDKSMLMSSSQLQIFKVFMLKNLLRTARSSKTLVISLS